MRGLPSLTLRWLPYLAIVVFIFFLPNYMEWVETAGYMIAQPDMQADYQRALIWAFALGVSILFWPIPQGHKVSLLLIWLVKTFVTLVFMLYYEYSYGLDAFHYFEESILGPFRWDAFEFGNGTENMINLVRFHQFLVPNSYHSMKVTFAMMGLLGVYLAYRAITIAMQRDDLRLLYLIALYPSILFWSSILGKDPIVFLGIGLYVLGVAGWRVHNKSWYLIVLLVGVSLAGFIRVWLAPILLAPLAVFLVKGVIGIGPRLLFLAVIVAAFLYAVEQFGERFTVETTTDLVATADLISKSWARGGSGQMIQGGFVSIGSMLAFLPQGGFAALFRPLPGEIMNPFGLLAGIENLFLLAMFVMAVGRTRLAELREPLILWAVVTVFAWTMVYSFVSYQNLGSAVRFKLQILPVLIPLLLHLSRRRRAD